MQNIIRNGGDRWLKKYGLSKVDFIKYKDYFFKMLDEIGLEKGRKEGKSEIINHIVPMMLQQNEDEEKIMQYTEIKKSKLNKMKKELYENTQNIYENQK
mgnify:CR=1 FL=1